MTECFKLSEVICNKTFKNILRNQIETDFHKEHLQADYRDGPKTDRSIKSHNKYYDITFTEPNDKEQNLKGKFTSHYVNGNLKSNFDLKNEPKPDDKIVKYSHIRTKSAIENTIPELKKEELYIFNQETQEPKTDKVKGTKKTFKQSNNSRNIMTSFKPSDDALNSLFSSQKKNNNRNYLNSEQIKKNIYSNYNTIDVSRSDKITNTTMNTVIKPSLKDKKFLQNTSHNFNGKRGFYC